MNNKRMAKCGGMKVLTLLLVLICSFDAESRVLSVPGPNQAYIFLHPYFKGKPWKTTWEQLDVITPSSDTMSVLRPVGFDFTSGTDSGMAVFSLGGGELFTMPVRCQTEITSCATYLMQFDKPQKISLAGHALPADRRFYVVKDQQYSFDSLRVAFKSSSNPLMVYIATIRTATNSVVKVDSLTLTQRRVGQAVYAINGYDNGAGQDLGIWVAGSSGLIRYFSYANHRWGAETVRDLATTPTVAYADSAYAGALNGGIFTRNASGSSFDSVAAASSPVRHIYSQGAVGDNGLFFENYGGWTSPRQFGTAGYRFANFTTRAGGKCVELLDSTWNYSDFIYRDLSCSINSTVPLAELMSRINKTPDTIVYSRLPLDLTINLTDPENNYKDYKLTLTNTMGTTNLKRAGLDTIGGLPDTDICFAGAVKMTSGRVRLTLSNTGVTVKHDCSKGFINTYCSSCYTKTTDSVYFRKWEAKANTIVLTAGSQRLSFYFFDTTHITVGCIDRSLENEIAGNVRCTNRNISITLPRTMLARATFVSLHDLQGRLLGSAEVKGRGNLTLPLSGYGSVVIVTCRMSDGSSVRLKVPLVR